MLQYYLCTNYYVSLQSRVMSLRLIEDLELVDEAELGVERL